MIHDRVHLHRYDNVLWLILLTESPQSSPLLVPIYWTKDAPQHSKNLTLSSPTYARAALTYPNYYFLDPYGHLHWSLDHNKVPEIDLADLITRKTGEHKYENGKDTVEMGSGNGDDRNEGRTEMPEQLGFELEILFRVRNALRDLYHQRKKRMFLFSRARKKRKRSLRRRRT